MNCNHYLDLAKAKHGFPSDYALAKALGTSQSGIGNYRKGRSHFDDAMAIRVAHLCDVPEAEVVFSMQIERARTDETKALWTGLLEKFSEGFRTLVLRANACGAWASQV